MPYYYDLNRATSTNGTANTETPHLRLVTVAEQETCAIKGLYGTMRNNTAGGGSLRMKHCTTTTATGGTAQTPSPRNLRGTAAAQTTAYNDATAITAGGTVIPRVSVGLAQTGGMGGWVALEPAASLQMQPNAASPLDVEVSSIAASASILFDLTLEFSESV